ncbi:MAG: phosphoribosylformylglycinamidine synthase [Lysobacterales bacterium CG02_land_8_20_14_3_00_62_12]|nr:MAG: phosphoribosylformylglycinamidine synthase [Xanthomonadales bacterium CG02_land_8_20_14_3_00_62_12]
MLLLAGHEHRSAFRRERLDQGLRAVVADLRLAQASNFFVVKAASVVIDGARLASVLDADTDAPDEVVDSLWVVPRIGTLSPWASKALELLRAAGLAVASIEQGWRYVVPGFSALTAAVRAQVLAVLHDPMTQSVLMQRRELAGIFQVQSPAALQIISLGAEPQQQLAAANRQLGLALSDDEIDYLADCYQRLGRDPSDAELMMFAQANSEHCRHKVFNANWVIDGALAERSLFAMIKTTHQRQPIGTLSAYHDNAAVIGTTAVARFYASAADRQWRACAEPVAIAIKCETHNHPTAIAPFAGASTGSGGEIRDEGATGRGAKPKAGLTGFTVSHLRIPGLPRPWEAARELPPRMASAFTIMRDAPLGAAAFNNEFGRPALCGYFRAFEHRQGALIRGYDKPIMLAGGLGNLHPDQVQKQKLQQGDAIIVLGGPAMLIGLGGGAASSLASGDSSAALDFASVQRDNPEMERRCQEVIDRCSALRADNPIVSVHDVGAGGLANAIPELLNDSAVGGVIDLRAIPNDAPGMSPMQIWCNESQERYVVGLRPQDLPRFLAICRRERCPCAVVGRATQTAQLVVADARLGGNPVDLPMAVLFGKATSLQRNAERLPVGSVALAIDTSIDHALRRVLCHPSVGSKSFLISIGDRSVGGLCARDQMVGAWQTPVADCALTLSDFSGFTGEAMAVGERSPLALLDAAASARMAVAEALLNIAAAPISRREDIKLSANWMAAVNHPGEGAALFDAVRALAMESCPALHLSIPVGKDSLSMQAAWPTPAGVQRVVSPLSLVVSAFAPVADVRRALTPELRLDAGPSRIVLIDFGGGKNRLGGSILAQCFGQLGEHAPDLDDAAALAAGFDTVQQLNRDDRLLAYHDRSDGGLLVALLEMAFAARCGLDIDLGTTPEQSLAALFNEELGALIQVREADLEIVQTAFAEAGLAACWRPLATPRADSSDVRLRDASGATLVWSLAELLALWQQTSHAMQRLRDHPDCADEERASVVTTGAHALMPVVGFDLAENVAAPFIGRGARPLIAILREQGVNGQVEMAAAFVRAGFGAIDVHMSDLLSGEETLARFAGLAACGGFSYGDVLGAGRGWATSILHHGNLATQFQAFFHDPNKFALGVCNGCQMLAEIKQLIPGAEPWPRFKRNRSEQFEARLSLVEVLDSPSIWFRGMAGSRLPVVVSHGEGRVDFSTSGDVGQALATLRYVTAAGAVAETYPANPNGSPAGLTGFTNADGRIALLMPHPERVHRSVQLSWRPRHWPDDSPWMRLFQNARAWLQ